MFITLPILLGHAITTLSLFQNAPPSAGPDGSAAPRKDRNASPREQRRRRPDRGDSFRDATPEQRRQMQVDRMIDRATRTYELDDNQKPLVRTELETIQRERRQAMGPEAEEYDKLREQMSQFWRPPPNEKGEPVSRDELRERRRRMMDDPEFRKVRDRLRELDRKYPVDWEDAMKRVETLLPPEQAEKGRKRIEEREARREERAQRWRERAELRRARRGEVDPNAAAAGTSVPTLPTKVESPSSAAPPVQPPATVLHPWEIYVREFITQHQLTAAQQAAAMAVLKDVRSRAAQTELSLREKTAQAEEMSDPAARAARLAELRKPTDQLFIELKNRLDGLLTASQRTPAP